MNLGELQSNKKRYLKFLMGKEEADAAIADAYARLKAAPEAHRRVSEAVTFHILGAIPAVGTEIPDATARMVGVLRELGTIEIVRQEVEDGKAFTPETMAAEMISYIDRSVDTLKTPRIDKPKGAS